MSALLGALTSRIGGLTRSTILPAWRTSVICTPTTWAATCLCSTGDQFATISKRYKGDAKAEGKVKDPKASGFTFPQFIHLPPVHPIAGKGDPYETKVVRKRQVVDPNVPNFKHIEKLKWTNWRMLRDCRRRYMFQRYHFDNIAYTNMRTCRMLPSSIKEAAVEADTKLPRDSKFRHLHIRCAVTGRSRGLLKKYRLSRLTWRHLADYNKLSGVIKAVW